MLATLEWDTEVQSSKKMTGGNLLHKVGACTWVDSRCFYAYRAMQIRIEENRNVFQYLLLILCQGRALEYKDFCVHDFSELNNEGCIP